MKTVSIINRIPGLLIGVVLVVLFRTPVAVPIASTNSESTIVLQTATTPSLGSSPSAQLDDLGAMMTSFNLPGACNSLTAFINACQAQSGKNLTEDQAEELIEFANLIKAKLDCQ